MKILEIKDKLPIKVKLNNSFYLDGSFDSGTILLIKEIKQALLYMVKNSKYEKNTHKQR